MLTSIKQGPNQLKTGTRTPSHLRQGHGTLRDFTANLAWQSRDSGAQWRGVWAGNRSSGLRTDVCYRHAVRPQAGQSTSLNPNFLSEVTS